MQSICRKSKKFWRSLKCGFIQIFEYLDCYEPIEVSKYIKELRRIRKFNDQVKLMEATNQAKKLKDFERKPWIFEVYLNELSCKILKDQQIKSGINEIHSLIEKMSTSANHISFVNIHLLLSIAYHIDNNFIAAEKTFDKLDRLLLGKEDVHDYTEAIISVKVSKIILYFKMNRLNKAIIETQELEEYQSYHSAYARLHYTFYFRSAGYFRLKNEKLAKEWFKKTLYLLIIGKNCTDINYLRCFEDFQLMPALFDEEDDLRKSFDAICNKN